MVPDPEAMKQAVQEVVEESRGVFGGEEARSGISCSTIRSMPRRRRLKSCWICWRSRREMAGTSSGLIRSQICSGTSRTDRRTIRSAHGRRHGSVFLTGAGPWRPDVRISCLPEQSCRDKQREISLSGSTALLLYSN